MVFSENVKLILVASCILALIAFSSIVILSYGEFNQQKCYSVGMAVEFNDHAAAAWVAYNKSWFNNVGINLTTFESYATGVALAAAIARGDIQVAWLCVGPAISAFKRGINLKIVAMTHEYGYAIVTNLSIIKSVNDLEGKSIGCVREGSMVDLLLHKAFKIYGINNVTILRMKPMDQLNALRSGQIVAAAIPEHYVAIARAWGFDILLKSQDIWLHMPGSALVVKQELIDKYPDAVRNLVKLTVNATHWIINNRNETAEILASMLHTNRSVILDSMTRLNYTNNINVTAMQELADFMAELGYIDKFNISEMIDLSFLSQVSSSQKEQKTNLSVKDNHFGFENMFLLTTILSCIVTLDKKLCAMA